MELSLQKTPQKQPSRTLRKPSPTPQIYPKCIQRFEMQQNGLEYHSENDHLNSSHFALSQAHDLNLIISTQIQSPAHPPRKPTCYDGSIVITQLHPTPISILMIFQNSSSHNELRSRCCMSLFHVTEFFYLVLRSC